MRFRLSFAGLAQVRNGGLGHSFLPPADWPPAGFCFPSRKRWKPPSLILVTLPGYLSILPDAPVSSISCSIFLCLNIYPLVGSYFVTQFAFPQTLNTVTMFRSAVVRSLRASVPRAVRTPAAFQIRSFPVARPAQFAPRFAYQGVRLYSAPAGLNKDEVEGRIVNLLKNFDKVRLFDFFCLLSVVH